MIFANLPAITEYLTFAVQEKVVGSRTGFSSQSCSAYVRADDREVRFSDHGDRHYTDGRMTVRCDERADEITDEFGDFDGYEVSDWWLADTIADAVASLKVAA